MNKKQKIAFGVIGATDTAIMVGLVAALALNHKQMKLDKEVAETKGKEEVLFHYFRG